nr:MAG TPA_asm: hypothetical protein [Caudoviricetes sp.]
MLENKATALRLMIGNTQQIKSRTCCGFLSLLLDDMYSHR